MRANAKRTIQKSDQEATEDIRPEEPSRETADDKLDFSSEFTNQDLGLASQGGASHLNWRRRIDEDEEEEKKRDQDEDDSDEEQAEEWRSGGWGEKGEESPRESPAQEDLSEDEEGQGATGAESSISGQAAAPEERPPGALSAGGAVQAAPPSRPQAVAPGPAEPPSRPVSTEGLSGSGNAPVSVVADPSTPAVQPAWSSDAPAAAPSLQPRAAGPVAIPQRLRPAAQLQLPNTGQAGQIAPDLAAAARRLILNASGEPGYEELVRLLSRFGLGALRMCSRSKVMVEILDEDGFADHPALWELGLEPEETPTDGAYVVGKRLVLVDRRCLTSKPRFFHPALYYFAHAFDHAQGVETFSSRKAAAVVACFESSTRASSGFEFVDELAAADPVRYFARSVAVYLGRDDCSDALWTHQDLYDFDRSMYDYLQYLFARLTV
jgi:hypothetical protein